MHAEETDVFVSGGGIAGLVAALGLADAGLSVTLADPAPPQALLVPGVLVPLPAAHVGLIDLDRPGEG